MEVQIRTQENHVDVSIKIIEMQNDEDMLTKTTEDTKRTSINVMSGRAQMKIELATLVRQHNEFVSGADVLLI